MTLLHDPLAHRLLAGTAVAVVLGELAATWLGQGRDGGRRSALGLADRILLFRVPPGATREDRWTRWVIGLSVYAAVASAIAIGKVHTPGAGTWWTFGLGLAIVLGGGALRDWSIVSLGRWFRREVTIEPGQRIVRRGPYRVLRHPSYTGLCLILTGFGLALAGWVGAAVVLAITCAGLLPRIRVEERALAKTFGADYEEYARSTARLVPHVW